MDYPTALGLCLGLIVGSFVNTVADRLPAGRSLIRPGSSCPGCGRRLGFWELIPVLSFLILRGRCHTCRRPIGWRSLVVEAGLGAVGALIAGRLGLSLSGAVALAVASTLVALSVIDWETGLLPDKLTLPLLAGGVAWSGLRGPGLKTALMGILICGGLVWAVRWSYRRLFGREGIGGGDPKLAGALGAWLGPMIGLEALVFGAGAGAMVGIGLVVSGRATWKTALPFGPFLSLSGLGWFLWRPPFIF